MKFSLAVRTVDDVEPAAEMPDQGSGCRGCNK
jgi:hypothetical protein